MEKYIPYMIAAVIIIAAIFIFKILNSKSIPSDYLSIVDFGAVPDDETDDFKAITACIAAAEKDNKIVLIPKGTFRHSKGIDIAIVGLRLPIPSITVIVITIPIAPPSKYILFISKIPLNEPLPNIIITRTANKKAVPCTNTFDS